MHIVIVVVCERVLVRFAPSLLMMLPDPDGDTTRHWQLLCSCAPVRALGGREEGTTALSRAQRCYNGSSPLPLVIGAALWCDYGNGAAGGGGLPTCQIAAIDGLCVCNCDLLGVEEVVTCRWHDASNATASLEKELGVSVILAAHWNHIGCRVMLMMGLDDL